MTTFLLNDLPSVLKVAEVAKVLRVDVKTVYGLIDRGELQAKKIGPRGLIRVMKSMVVAYLDGITQPKMK